MWGWGGVPAHTIDTMALNLESSFRVFFSVTKFMEIIMLNKRLLNAKLSHCKEKGYFSIINRCLSGTDQGDSHKHAMRLLMLWLVHEFFDYFWYVTGGTASQPI